MHRIVRLFVGCATLATLGGCATSEINAENKLGLSGNVPSGTAAQGYGDHRGDSVFPPGSETVHHEGTETKVGEH